MKITASEKVLDKMQKKHGVALTEVRQCFVNRDGGFLEDQREEHKTEPPTYWFIAATNQRRLLKVAFIPKTVLRQQVIEIRTAYEPNIEEVRIYEKYGK